MAAPNRRRPDAAARLTKAERKRQLLTHAKQLFVTLGYRQTTLDQIAAAADVKETVLTRHFENKKVLFVEILREIRQAAVARWQTEAATLADPPAKLHVLADLYLGSTHEHAVEFRILHRTLVECTDDEEIMAILRDFYLEGETLLAGVIAEGQQTGVFRRSLDPRVGAWELIRTAMAYTLTEPLGVPLYGESDYIPRAIDCLLHCLLKTDV
jgi:AcrR family transcriptional regulator